MFGDEKMIYIPKFIFNKENIENYFETFSKDYEVKINGIPCDVNVCRVSAMPFNRIWQGRQRDVSQTELASFINFYGDEAVTVEVKCNRQFNNCVVRPLSKGVNVKRNGDLIVFTLKQNGNYVFELDDSHFALHIFYNIPFKTVEPNDVTYYFGPGVHRPLLLNLKSNESVYIHPEAMVYTTIYCDGAENVKIFGGGILNNCCQERVAYTYYDRFPIGNIRMFDTKGIIIEDVILMDSSNWVCALFNCDNILIDGIKIIGQWRYNTDGIDLINSSNAKIQNCFVRTFDDSICIKAINNHSCCENIEVDNCVCWCQWGKTLEIGLETSADEYRNISYSNCDLIHNDAAALAISNGNYANIHNISYENINIEFQSYTRAPVIQQNDEMTYPDNLFAPIGEAIRIENHKIHDEYKYKTIDERDKKYGKTYDIVYKNINVYKDEEMDECKIWIQSYSSDEPIENVSINNITVNGVYVKTLDMVNIKCENAKNVIYNK